MTTYTKADVIRLVRDELRMTNKALKLKTEFDGLTDSDWQYIGVIASALQEPSQLNAKVREVEKKIEMPTFTQRT
jgi:hypothetical protein